MKFTIPLLAAAVIAAAGANTAEAAFVQFGSSSNGDFTINYAVFQRDSGEASISAGVTGAPESGGTPSFIADPSIGPFDDTAFTAFFYQIVDDATGGALRDVESLLFSNPTNAFYTSGGFLSGGSPFSITGGGVTLATPLGDYFTDDVDNGTMNAGFASFGNSGGPFADNSGESDILFLTTDARNIVLTNGTLSFDGGSTSLEFAVASVPEPGSMALFALFGLAGGGAAFRRKKKGDAVA